MSVNENKLERDLDKVIREHLVLADLDSVYYEERQLIDAILQAEDMARESGRRASLRQILAEEGILAKSANTRALGKKVKGLIKGSLKKAQHLVYQEMNDAYAEMGDVVDPQRVESYAAILRQLLEIEKAVDRTIAS